MSVLLELLVYYWENCTICLIPQIRPMKAVHAKATWINDISGTCKQSNITKSSSGLDILFQ